MNNNNPIKNLQNSLDATLEKKSKLIKKKLKKSNASQDYIYKIVATIFGLLLAYEAGKWLWSQYTLERALVLFICISLLYFFLKTSSKNSFASKTMKFLKTHRDSFVYGSFIVYFLIFLATFIFKVSDIFVYASYAMIAIYAFFKTLGFQIDYTLPKTKIFNSVFLRGMIISMSVFLVVCHYILSAYSVNISTKLLYIALGLGYILLFIFFFGEGSFKDLRWYLKSRRFKRFVASNTYNILSLLVIFFTVSGLAYKFGYFDNIFKKTPVEVVVETPVEEPIEQVITVEEIEPEVPTTRVVVKQIRDVYNFTNRLEVGSEGEEVSRLQGFLGSMEYLESEPTGVFDEETRVALRDTLMEKCDWPESTQGVLGNQAMACINNLEVQVVEDIPEGESAEETIEELSEENQEVEVEVIDTPEVEPEVVEETPVVEESTPESEVVIPEETTPEPEPAAPIIEEVEPEPETTPEVTEDEPDTNTTQIRRVSDIYIFTETLQAGNTGNGVSNLKDILSVLGYYRGELSPDFDEETRIALRNTLIAECNWPESTKGILGPQARSCINTIELPNQ